MNNLIRDFNRKISIYNKVHDVFNVKQFLEIDKDLTNVPFWNQEIQQFSKGLLIPHKFFLTDDNSGNFPTNTWFRSEFLKAKDDVFCLQKINHIPLYQDNEITKVRKIILYPTTTQAYVLREMLGIYRYFYNRTINVLNNYDKNKRTSYYNVNIKDSNSKITISVPKDKSVYNFYYLRSILKDNKPNWISKVKLPSHEIDAAINEAIVRYTINLNNYKNTKRVFKMRYKTKKDLIQTINIEKLTIKKDGIFKNLKYNGAFVFRELKMSESISKFPNYCGSSITYHRKLNKFGASAFFQNAETIFN
jgi:hypothetical protein